MVSSPHIILNLLFTPVRKYLPTDKHIGSPLQAISTIPKTLTFLAYFIDLSHIISYISIKSINACFLDLAMWCSSFLALRTYNKKLKATPLDRLAPPRNVICMCCDTNIDPVYVKRYKALTICSLPVVPVFCGYVGLVCPNCCALVGDNTVLLPGMQKNIT